MLYPEFCDRFFVSRETFDRLDHYHSLLNKWQPHINLISPTT
ncbi:16S rRNA (guanine(527)-N(7))-methyltransferase RsmG, partial [bacterium]|nr:16S rRNA (guanine(527)-N(7))-methyltransferase RsmG [bacterium]